MRRPGIGVARRSGFRGIGGGAPASAAPFDPLTDPDLLGLWAPGDATDDGTTLTVPNRLTSGPSFTSTGATRATLDADGLDGVAPGIVLNGAVLSCATLGLAGLSACTVIQVMQATGTGAAYLHRYATTADGAFRALRSQPGAGRITQTLEATSNVVWTGAAGSREYLWFPQVLVHRYDPAVAAVPTWSDGGECPGAVTGTPVGGVFPAGTFYWGSESNGVSALPGFMGPMAIIGRALTDEEIADWTLYLQTLAVQQHARNIIWTGDSITACNTASGAQWRADFQSLYDAEGDGIRWYRPMGQFSPANVPFTLDYCNAGGGNTIAITLANLATYSYGTAIRTGLRQCIVPILLGTNDIAVSGLTNAAIATAYGGLLDEIEARLPGALCVVQKLLPRTDGSAAQVQDLNDAHLAGVVSAAVSRGIDCILDDTLATLPGITYLDAVHPDAASGPAMAAALYAAARGWAGVAP